MHKIITEKDLIKILSDRLRCNLEFSMAIDGGSAAGKSTLAESLKGRFEADGISTTVFHMDDFYLRPEQRTEERYAEPGGNVDRERFLEEVLVPLSKGSGSIRYRPLECPSLTFKESMEVMPGRLRIIEGAYSHHPDLRDYYDLRVFMDVDPELQADRVKNRNTPDQQERFFAMWIPLENTYFAAFDIKEKSDLLINVR